MFPIIISLMHSDVSFSVEYMNEEGQTDGSVQQE